MLTNRSAVRAGSALVLALAMAAPANAGVLTLSCIQGSNLNCVGQYGVSVDPYVRAVPEPLGDEEKAQVNARERQWMTRCHPVIEHDKYGVAHYQYTARGCEYGLGTD